MMRSRFQRKPAINPQLTASAQTFYMPWILASQDQTAFLTPGGVTSNDQKPAHFRPARRQRNNNLIIYRSISDPHMPHTEKRIRDCVQAPARPGNPRARPCASRICCTYPILFFHHVRKWDERPENPLKNKKPRIQASSFKSDERIDVSRCCQIRINSWWYGVSV